MVDKRERDKICRTKIVRNCLIVRFVGAKQRYSTIVMSNILSLVRTANVLCGQKLAEMSRKLSRYGTHAH